MDLKDILSDKLLFDSVVGLCGDGHWLIGLRGTCEAFRAAISPPKAYFDSNEMLLDGAATDNVSLCAFALRHGACRYYGMLRAALKHGSLGVYKLAVETVPYVTRGITRYSGAQQVLLSDALKGGNEQICTSILARMIGNPYRLSSWLSSTIIRRAGCTHFDVLIRMMEGAAHAKGLTLVDALKNDPEQLGSTCEALYIYCMEAYGYYGETKYKDLAHKIIPITSAAEDMLIFDNDTRELRGIAQSGDYEAFMKRLEEIGSSTDLLTKCIVVSTAPSNWRIYAECEKRLGKQLRHAYMPLIVNAVETNNMTICERLIAERPALAQEMLRCSVEHKKYGAQILEKALSLGAVCNDQILLRAAEHDNVPACRAILSRGVPHTDAAIITAMKHGYLHITMLIVEYERKRLDLRFASNSLDSDTARVFGFTTELECHEHIAKFGCADIKEVPLLTALYPDDEYIARKYFLSSDYTLFEGPAYEGRVVSYMMHLRNSKYHPPPRSI